MEKKLTQKVEQVKKDDPEARVEAWAEDEHRIGFKPIHRIIWVEKGENPIAPVNWKYEWLWLIGLVHPCSGQTYWWIVPQLSNQILTQALKDFAEHFQLGPKRRVVLAIDQAGFHPSDKVEVPDGIHIIEMPPKSPELQPAERLWPLADEPLANRTFSSLDELEEVSFHRCQTLLERPDWIRGYAKYYWWPDDAN